MFDYTNIDEDYEYNFNPSFWDKLTAACQTVFIVVVVIVGVSIIL